MLLVFATFLLNSPLAAFNPSLQFAKNIAVSINTLKLKCPQRPLGVALGRLSPFYAACSFNLVPLVLFLIYATSLSSCFPTAKRDHFLSMVYFDCDEHSVTTDLVVAPRHGQDVAGDGPADVPNHVVELVQQFGRPRVARRLVACPDEHASVLPSPLDQRRRHQRSAPNPTRPHINPDPTT